MATDKLIVSQDAHHSTGDLQISIPREDLGSFLSSLLGQQRTIIKKADRFFLVDHRFLINIHHIIQQRINSQQKANLVSYLAIIHFSDNRTETISSAAGFEAFSDSSEWPTTKIEVSWTYLIQFPNKSIPEKQTISIVVDTGVIQSNNSKMLNRSLRVLASFLFDESESEIVIKLEYTEYSWGIDLLRHIETEFKSRFIYENSIKKFTREISTIVLPLVTLLAGSAGLPALYMNLVSSVILSKQNSILLQLKDQNFLEKIQTKLDFLIAGSSQVSPIAMPYFWIIVISVVLLLSSLWLFVLQKPKSFLVLNSASSRQKTESDTRARAFKSGTLVTFFLGVVAGILANQITVVINKLF